MENIEGTQCGDFNLKGNTVRSKESSQSDIIENAVWREKAIDGKKPVERKLTSYDSEHLNQFYNLCHSILYSNDRFNPGKVVILSEIKEQKDCCNIMLFIRWMQRNYGKSEFTLRSSLQKFIDKHIASHANVENYKMSKIMENCPEDFKGIVIKDVMRGCVDALGAFNKKRITRKMLYLIGVFLNDKDKEQLTPTKEESETIASYYNTKGIPYKVSKKGIPVVSKSDVMKLRLGLNLSDEVRFSLSGLTYSQFAAAIKLNNVMKYSEMTNEQLILLRNRLLPIIESNVSKQADEWKKRMRNIEIVAKYRGFRLTLLTGTHPEQ